MTAIAMGTYRVAARNMARQMDAVVGSRVDATGHDRDDYEARLTTKAWSTALGFRTVNAKAKLDDEVKYVCRSMWNELRSFQRTRARVQGHVVDLPVEASERFEDEHPQPDAPDLDARLDAGAAAQQLRQSLSPSDWALALRLMEGYAGGSRAEIFDSEIDASSGALHVRVYRLRQRARKILGRE